MKYIDEFRSRERVKKAAAAIKKLDLPGEINIMEVCGTHTQNFFRFGLEKLLPGQVCLIAGPGCPVCVSSQEYIDEAIAYAREKDTIILTFGDMLRVPGTRSTLESERAKKRNVFVVYSALDSLVFARQYPAQRIIFLAVGFETTAATFAATAFLARKERINNLYFFSSLKTIPPAMRFLLQDQRLNIHGFLCPGHVSTIIGAKAYDFIPREYGIGCCVAGFEPLDILEGLYLLLRQVVKSAPAVENQYSRAVTRSGNVEAQRLLAKVFAPADASWRGLGVIPKSGLKFNNAFSRFDARKMMPLRFKPEPLGRKQKLCRCGEVIKGQIRPDECALFRKDCSPEHPYGPCMVSIEGTCNAYYRYRN
jgi:hydrogenase expression/formation protein HypD